MSWQSVKDSFSIQDIGAPLLANLAKGIYTPEAVLREYVQNGGDSYLDLQEAQRGVLPLSEKVIDIYLQADKTLAIQDRGIGMNLQDIKNYKRIALSSKVGKDRAGFRGIGIWAAFDACDVLQVVTTKLGDPHRYRLTLKFADMRAHVSDNIDVEKLLASRFKIEVDDADRGEHYTQVRLQSVHDEFADLLNAEELARIVGQILPCRLDPSFKFSDKINDKLRTIDGYQEYTIKVDDTEVFRTFPSTLTEPVFELLKDKDNEEYAFAWYCTSPTQRSVAPTEQSNFRLRIHNIAIGSRGIYSQEEASHWGITTSLKSSELLDWYAGEIHIVNPDVRPNTSRIELELDTKARKAISLVRDFYRSRITYRRAVSVVTNHIAQVESISQQLAGGGTYSAVQAQRFVRDMKKFEQLSSGPSSSSEKDPEKRRLLKERRRILRAREAQTPDVVKKRRDVISQLEQLAKQATRSKKGQASKAARSATGSPATSAASTAGATAADVDYEQLLTETLMAVQKHLDDQEDLAETLSEAIEEIFKRHGVLVAA
jgi:hypothetical protein